MKLLTQEISSPKLVKSAGSDYLTAILYLASAAYDTKLCDSATPGCIASCLIHKAGRGVFDSVANARKRKSDMLLADRAAFISQLHHEIGLLVKRAAKQGKKPALRLNGGSDLDWYDVYASFPNVQFWEYTKNPARALKLSKLPNVHVTYSVNEYSTDKILRTMSMAGINLATVFDTKKGKPLPATYLGLPVIDGDTTDLRFFEPTGVVVGLRIKSMRKVSKDITQANFVKVA
jgi:hypothetical protein